MENVFDEVLGSASETVVSDDAGASTNTDTSELGSEYDLDLSETEEEPEVDEQVNSEVEISSEVNDNPTNHAFAQMRVQNKEYSTKINELDAIAKAAGLKDIDDLIAKSKEAQIKKEAQNKGISEELAKELAEMRDFKARYEQDKADAVYKEKENTLVNNLQNFITTNKLSQDAVNKLSDDLVKDGLTNDYLMGLSKGALNRILGAYVGTDIQKNLERKETIKNELPLNQTSKIDTQSINKQIDNLAKQWAGRI